MIKSFNRYDGTALCIEFFLQFQQFCITKLMMLIFSIIVSCRFLKNTFKETFQWLLPNMAYSIWKILLRKFNYVECLNMVQSIRHGLWPLWNIAPVDKVLWVQWNMPRLFIDTMKKSWFCKRLFYFLSDDYHGKR